MNKKEACQLLNVSMATLTRMMHAGVITCTRLGTDQFSPVEFTYADLGLNPPENIARGTTETKEPAPDNTTPVLPELGHVPTEMPEAEFLAALNLWSSEELEAMKQEWLKPACPGGPVTNSPDDTSSTMPSPRNYARVLAVNSILQKRYLIGRKPIYLKQPYRTQVDQHCRDHNAMVAGVGSPEQYEHLWKGRTE